MKKEQILKQITDKAFELYRQDPQHYNDLFDKMRLGNIDTQDVDKFQSILQERYEIALNEEFSPLPIK